MESPKAQLIFTDPPYNVPIQGHVSGFGSVQHREFLMASGEMSEGEFERSNPLRSLPMPFSDCSSRGDFVLDAFFGSGTTLIAAERTGRCCRGLELDPVYVGRVDKVLRRWPRHGA
jgi:DNA modification methylase